MRILLIVIIWGIVTGSVFSEELTAPLQVDEIVQKANYMALYQGADMKGKVTMKITDKQGRIRERKFNMLRKNDDGKDQNQKFYTYFQSPADVRKMAFMVHKHAELEKDDDRWLYMPGLDLVKRIAAGDKRTSFAGSDFLYEDISGRSPEEDIHELIETTEDHYIIKNVPKNPGSVEFEYYIAVIEKSNFLPVKMEFFKKGERLYRVIQNMKIENIPSKKDGRQVTYSTVTVSVAKDLDSGGSTEMTFSSIKYNIGLKDNLFTERYLRRPPREAVR